MRIIAGRLRRRPLDTPEGHLTRPTMDRTRESLFHLVGSRMDLKDARVLDLFAGSGALGLEAVSRGAADVVFVESSGQVLQFARQNAENLEVDDQCWFLRSDAVAYLTNYSGPPFDLIMADPPYGLEEMTQMPALARPHLTPGGLFVLEHDKRHTFDESYPGFDTSRPYGRTHVTVFLAEQ